MKLAILGLVLGLTTALHANAEPFWGCHMTISDVGERQGRADVIKWVEAEMSPGSRIPMRLDKQRPAGFGEAQEVVKLQTAEGQVVEFLIATSANYTGKFDFISEPFYDFTLKIQARFQGESEFRSLVDERQIVSSYVPGFALVSRDLNLNRVEYSNGVPKKGERAENYEVGFFCIHAHQGPRK